VIRILFSGSRVHGDPGSIARHLDAVADGHGQVTLIHGRCDPRGRYADGRIDWELAVAEPWRGPFLGGDWHAHHHAVTRGWTIEECAAEWSLYGKAAGGIRNQRMVARGADVLVAAPLGASPGTRDCMARTRRAGIRVVDISAPPEAEGLW
jgi:hypothetical protein